MWTARILFGSIILVFVFFGVERFGTPSGGAAATVNGKAISKVEFDNSLRRVADFYQKMMPGMMDNPAMQGQLKQMALGQLVTLVVMGEEAERLGISISDQEVRKVLLNFSALQKDGKFSREYYETFLKYYRTSAAQFEGNIRKEAAIERVRRAFEDGVLNSASFEAKEEELKKDIHNVEFLKLDREALASKLTVSKAETDAFLADQSKAGQIKEYYNLHKSEFNHDAEVKARHILIKAEKGKADQEKAAREKIAKVLAELKTQSFESLAKKYSEDPGSKTNGGDLGFFGKGRMVPEFEKAAFELALGKVSEPIQTQYGYHIIKVEEKREAQTVPVEQAQPKIAAKLAAKEKIDREIKSVEDLLAKEPESAIKKVMSWDKNLKWEETGNFTAGDESIPKLGGSEEIMAVIWNVTPEHPVAPKLIAQSNSLLLARYKKPADKKDEKAQAPSKPEKIGQNLYDSWAGKITESAKIWRNPAVFASEQEVD